MQHYGIEYFNKYPEFFKPDMNNLFTIHRLFVHETIFSSLDIMMGIRPSFDPAAAFDKVVVKGHGGTCRSINLAAKFLLQKIGFKSVDCFSSEISHIHNIPVPKGSAIHMTMIVSVQNDKGLTERYLFDPGFGNGHRVPLPLTGEVVEDIMTSYRVIGHDNGLLAVQELWKNDWITQFTFDPTMIMDEAEFQKHTDFTYDDNHFYRNNLYVQRCSATGVLQLHNDTFRVQDSQGHKFEQTVLSLGGIKKTLIHEFGLPQLFVEEINKPSELIPASLRKFLDRNWASSSLSKTQSWLEADSVISATEKRSSGESLKKSKSWNA